MTAEYDRRQALKWIGRTLIGGSLITVAAGCGGGDDGEETEGGESQGGESQEGPTHAAPHPENETLSDAEANGESLSGATRSPGAQQAPDNPGVNLQHSPEGNQYCGNCSLYVPDQNGDGFGACLSVAGKIHPCDWCVLYTEHTGEGVVSCAAA